MIAIKDFRYYDFRTKQSVDVHAGESVDTALLGRNKVDLEKLYRTKFVDRGEGADDPQPRKKRVRSR